MKTFTPSEIRELIADLRQRQARETTLTDEAANALEALASEREWKPIDEKAIDGRWYEVWVPREELGTHECIFVAKHVKDIQDGDFWMDVADIDACIDPAPTHYRELPPPPSTDKEGAAS